MLRYLLLINLFYFSNSLILNMNWNNLPINIKTISRNWFITRAKMAGIPWDLYVSKRSDPNTIEKLDDNKKIIEDTSIKYPPYYTKPFHGYDYGNLEWLAAQEGEPATISISTNYWKNIDPYISEKWLRHNITTNLLDYIDYHDKLRLNDLINQNSNILDVGCSIGISTEFLKNEFEDSNVEGLDLSPFFYQWLC